MARIQHPRASDEFARDPPSRVTVPVGGGSYETVELDDDHYFEVDDEHAEETMEALASSYDVEYTDDGDVVGAGGETESETETEGGTESEPIDWDEDLWFEHDYQARAATVRNGSVDPHLDRIEEAESSQTVLNAVDDRQAELSDSEEDDTE